MRPLRGAQSAVWIETANPLALVGGSQYRSMATIDNICLALEPLGDTLSVVVNLQDVMATTSEGADIVAELPDRGRGRAMIQPTRRVDVIGPEVRKAFRAQQTKK